MEELIALLQKAATASGRAQDQRDVTLSLARFNATPQAPHLYLALFCDRAYPPEMRGMAGLLVKNVLKGATTNQPEDRWALMVVRVLCEPGETQFVVSTAATILAVVMARRVDLWPSVLCSLLHAVNSQQHSVTVQCLLAVERVLEEIAGCAHGSTPPCYDGLWSVCLALLGSSPDSSVTVNCLRIVNHLLYDDSATAKVDIDALLSVLSRCAVSADADVKRLTCSSLSILSDTFDAERMAPSVPAIRSFMLRALQDADTAVALEACEYWNAQAERGIEDSGVVAQVVPVLVQRVVYDADDPDCHLVVDASADTNGACDANGDVRPRHRSRDNSRDNSRDADSDQESDSSDTSDTDYSEWTLKKCAASTIDLMSSGVDCGVFLQVLLPCCQQLLDSPVALHREAAILVLGAVAEGCREGLRPHLPTLLPFIIQNAAHHQHPMVRSISAWTLSRFHWFITDSPDLLHGCMAALLDMLTGSVHVKTRRAVCSALAVFCGEADLGFCREWLVKAIVEVYPKYTNNTLTYLLDLISSMSSIGDPQLLNMAMATFLHTTSASVNLTYAVMEAICGLLSSQSTNTSTSDGNLEGVYEKAINMVTSTLRQCDENDAESDVELSAAALDLIGALVKGVGRWDARLVPLLFACTCDSALLQSAFAVFGDLAVTCPQLIAGQLEHICQLLIDHFDPTQLTSDVATNAVWAFGCVAAHCDPLPVTLAKAIQSLSRSLLLPNQSRSYYDNVVVSLGKTAGRVQDVVEIGACLPRFTKLVSVSRDQDRDAACVGMLAFISRHAAHYLPKWPVECIRIAVSAPRGDPRAVAVIGMVRDGVVGRERWGGWRAANLPDIAASRLD